MALRYLATRLSFLLMTVVVVIVVVEESLSISESLLLIWNTIPEASISLSSLLRQRILSLVFLVSSYCSLLYVLDGIPFAIRSLISLR